MKYSEINRGFRIHAIVFALTMTLLGVIDWYTAEPYWAHWVLGGWGAGLAGHAWLALGKKPGTQQA